MNNSSIEMLSNAIAVAIQQSATSNGAATLSTADIIATKHILIQHQQRMIKAKDEEDYQRLYVRRSRVYSDAMRSFGKPSFDVEKMLKVSFIGEEAVDDGGPRREFFRDLYVHSQAIQNLKHLSKNCVSSVIISTASINYGARKTIHGCMGNKTPFNEFMVTINVPYKIRMRHRVHSTLDGTSTSSS